jgi:hypothetical protein
VEEVEQNMICLHFDFAFKRSSEVFEAENWLQSSERVAAGGRPRMLTEVTELSNSIILFSLMKCCLTRFSHYFER